MLWCSSSRSSLISRSVRLASSSLSNVPMIFLMATFEPAVVSRQLQTTPYAPLPTPLISE